MGRIFKKNFGVYFCAILGRVAMLLILLRFTQEWIKTLP